MKLCGGVGFTSQLAGEALSVLNVHLFQPSLQVLSLLDLQRPKHNRPADHMKCAARSKRETRKRTITKRSPIRLLYSPDPATETTNFLSVLAAFDIRVHLTHLFAFNDIVSSTRFSARCIGLVLPLEMSMLYRNSSRPPSNLFVSRAAP